MAGETDVQKLELRIKELEDQLKSLRSSSQVTPEDLQAFQRVRDAMLATCLSGCISECARCIGPLCIVNCVTNCVTNCITVCITRCIFECTCGPCLQDRPAGGGGGRFGGLGG
jgi:hypothetical protein